MILVRRGSREEFADIASFSTFRAEVCSSLVPLSIWVLALAHRRPPARASVKQTFPVEMQDLNLIFTAPDGKSNVLTKQYFDIMWEFDEMVRSLSVEFDGVEMGYSDLCYVNEAVGSCANLGALEFWSHNKTAYDVSMSKNNDNVLIDLAAKRYPITNEVGACALASSSLYFLCKANPP